MEFHISVLIVAYRKSMRIWEHDCGPVLSGGSEIWQQAQLGQKFVSRQSHPRVKSDKWPTIHTFYPFNVHVLQIHSEEQRLHSAR